MAGPSRLGLAFLLLPAGPAVVLVDGYEFFGLPEPAPGRLRGRGSSGAIELGLSCGAPFERNASLAICPSTCPLCAEESSYGD